VSSPWAGFIALGVFGLVFGAGYILVGIFGFLKTKNDGLGKVFSALALSLFPLYQLVYVIVFMSIIGGDGLSVTDYILYIILMAFALSSAIFAFVTAFAKNENLLKVFEISLIGFIAVEVLTFVFPIGGGMGTLGGLSLPEIVLFVGFAVLAIDLIAGVLGVAKEKAEKALEEKEPEQPAEEPAEEESEEVQIEETQEAPQAE
ncbi:MAG: hypothetical protein J6X03_05255, partial [Bacilli bacterium]|nr:hypothetical protein [Bacilli bacterium]